MTRTTRSFAHLPLTLLGALSTSVVLSGAAHAACAPAADNTPNPLPGTTVTCSGVTDKQNDPYGYGTGNQSGITIKVQPGASVLGHNVNGAGINVSDATIDNSGSILGAWGILLIGASTSAVTNQANGQISALVEDGIYAGGGALTVTNSGQITAANFGINGIADVALSNNAGGSITGASGVASNANLNVTNAGSINGTAGYGLWAVNSMTVTNSGTLTGTVAGVNAGSLSLTNSGTITSSDTGILSQTDAEITNKTGGLIKGDQVGINTWNNLTLTNAGTIIGTHSRGVWATSATVNNLVGGTISSDNGYAIILWTDSIVNNAGTIAGNLGAVGFNAANNSLTNTGTITSSAGDAIYFSGDNASVFNAGTITAPDGVNAINFGGAGNTLTLASTSKITGFVIGSGNDILNLAGKTAGTFDISKVDPAGQYQGFATINKLDSSTWTLTGVGTFGGPIIVDGGKLVVNGSVASASLVDVEADSTLGGIGTLGNTTVAKGGTLAPGGTSAGGILTVQGSLTFDAAAIYLVQVSSAAASRTNVSADATLGGTVKVASPDNSYAFGSAKTILSSTAGYNGTKFASLTTAAGIAGSLAYTATDVNLTLTSALGQISGLNANQKAVANALDAGFNGAGSSGALGAVFAGNVLQNLSQLGGETGAAVQQSSFNAMNTFMALIGDPSSAGRLLNPATPGASGYAEEEPRSGTARDAFARMPVKGAPQLFSPRWNVWTAGFGGSQTTDGNATAGTSSTTSRLYGGAIGVDYLFSPDTIAGVALAGGATSFSVTGNGSGRSDLFEAGAFVRHTAGPAYLTATAAFGWQDVTTDRTVTISGIDRLRGSFSADTYSGRLEGGWRFATPVVNLTPYAAAQVTAFALPAYTETAVIGAPAFALSYAGKTVTDTRSELGLRTDNTLALGDSALTLRSRIAWAHDFNPNRSVTATFVALPGASFVTNGAAAAANSALASASAELSWMNGWSVGAGFEGEFSNVTRSYAGKATLRYAW